MKFVDDDDDDDDEIQFVATGSCVCGFWENLGLWYVLVWEGVNVINA